MEVFIKTHGYRLWNIIEKGNIVPKGELAMLELNYKGNIVPKGEFL